MRKLITTDNHLTPPPWLLDEVPEHLRDHVPQLFKLEDRPDGRYLVSRIKAQDVGMMAGIGRAEEIKVESDADIGRILAGFPDPSVGANGRWDPEGRLEDMAREGVVAAVLIGAPEFAVPKQPETVEAQRVYYRILNDWLYDTYKDHLGAFAPGINLPWMDVAASVKELERCAALGMRPGLLPDAIHTHLYSCADWEPLWEAADSLGVPLTLHISGINTPEWAKYTKHPRWPGQGFEQFWSSACDEGRTIISLVFTGMLQKYPNLRITMTEGYAFWLAGLIQFLDHHWTGRMGRHMRSGGFSGAAGRLPELEAPPSYYIRQQCAATFMWDPVAIENRHHTGLKSLMWGNDYPHPEGAFPDSQEWVEKQFAGVPEDEIYQMTFGNAKELFGFDV